MSLRHGDRVIAVTMQLSVPALRGRDWSCRVYLSRVMGRPIEVHGLDELGALANGLQLLRDLIAAHKGLYSIWWLEEGDDGLL